MAGTSCPVCIYFLLAIWITHILVYVVNKHCYSYQYFQLATWVLIFRAFIYIVCMYKHLQLKVDAFSVHSCNYGTRGIMAGLYKDFGGYIFRHIKREKTGG